MHVYIGVDCGATNLRVGLFDKNGTLLVKSKVPSPLKIQPEQLAYFTKEQLLALQKNIPDAVVEVKGIGVGTPGPVDFETGAILPSANLGNSQPIYICNQFNKEFTCHTSIERDTNIALIGEMWQGQGVGKKEVVMLTLGSGVGGAVVINGELDHGKSGKAGEIGHMIIDAQNLPTCGLGHQGCFEAMINSAKNLDQFSTYLGYGLANIVDIFNPEMIIIGGGKIAMGDFLPDAVKVMKKAAMNKASLEVSVVYAKLGEWSGIYGGAKMALDCQGQ